MGRTKRRPSDPVSLIVRRRARVGCALPGRLALRCHDSWLAPTTRLGRRLRAVRPGRRATPESKGQRRVGR